MRIWKFFQSIPILLTHRNYTSCKAILDDFPSAPNCYYNIINLFMVEGVSLATLVGERQYLSKAKFTIRCAATCLTSRRVPSFRTQFYLMRCDTTRHASRGVCDVLWTRLKVDSWGELTHCITLQQMVAEQQQHTYFTSILYLCQMATFTVNNLVFVGLWIVVNSHQGEQTNSRTKACI